MQDIFSYKDIKRLCENIFSKHIIIINLNIVLWKLVQDNIILNIISENYSREGDISNIIIS